MKIEKTNRNFDIAYFQEYHGIKCSIQKSSIATEDLIWLGIDNLTKLTVFDKNNNGKYVETSIPENWKLYARMELTRDQVKELLPILKNFVKYGELTQK